MFPHLPLVLTHTHPSPLSLRLRLRQPLAALLLLLTAGHSSNMCVHVLGAGVAGAVKAGLHVVH